MIGALAIHPSPSGDTWDDSTLRQLFDGALEDGVKNAGLPPDLTGLEFSIGMEAREFRTGPRAAR